MKDVTILETTNLTVRIDKSTKKEFDTFCDNVGINATAAVNMFIKAVVRTRELPFIVTDTTSAEQDRIALAQMRDEIMSMQEQSARSGNAEMTLEEINAEISAYRNEKREQS